MPSSPQELPTFYSDLSRELVRRSARALLGHLGVASEPLRSFLSSQLERRHGALGSFVADPVFEGAFPWELHDQSMEALAKSGELSADLVNAMDAPPGEDLKEHRFPRQRKPFRHQIETWRTL